MTDNKSIEASTALVSAIDASPSLRNKKDLIMAFVESVNTSSDIGDDWRKYIEAKKQEELMQIIIDEDLNEAETQAFIENAFKNGEIQTEGTEITRILPAVSRFSPDGWHGVMKQTVIQKLTTFFEKFLGMGDSL